MQRFHQYLLESCILRPISAASRAQSLQKSLLNPLLALPIYEAAHKSQKWGKKEGDRAREKFRESFGTQVKQGEPKPETAPHHYCGPLSCDPTYISGKYVGFQPLWPGQPDAHLGALEATSKSCSCASTRATTDNQ